MRKSHCKECVIDCTVNTVQMVFFLCRYLIIIMRIIIFNMKAVSLPFLLYHQKTGATILKVQIFRHLLFFRPQAFWMFFLLLIFYGQPAFSAASFLLFLPVYRTALRLQKPESVSSENFLSHHIPLPYWILPLDFRYPDLRILFGRC